uniref:Reverse transcriptase (RNA-dependent DNA pol) n=1 Tax=Malus domestica TaxID=3750 RepID=E4Z8P6_MALDO|nr:Reverse transcriptase (RNA-dependent DNA pol [Malus domestica]
MRKNVMNAGTTTIASEARAYFSSDKKYFSNDKKYKGRNPHLKCKHCDAIGHVRDHWYILHPELKLDFMKNERFIQKKPQFSSYKANHALSLSIRGSDDLLNFTSNPTTLINEFAAYLQMKKEVSGSDEAATFGNGNSIALLGKFAGFLADSKKLTQDNMQVGSKWIYKIKFHSDGSIERYKASLVARGFTQTYAVDYKEAFTLVAKMNTNAFLHVDLGDVYMKLPPGHHQYNEPGMGCRLHKSVYGLKQSPRAWDNADEITNLKVSLQQKFSIRDLGRLKYFLGIEMTSSSKGLFLNQRKYILDHLTESNMKDAKPVQTPFDSKLKLSLEGKPLPNIGCYQRLVGNQINRKSTTSYYTFVGGNLVTWKSKKQNVIAKSSAEAEYRLMASTTCELIWLKGLLSDLRFQTRQPMSMYCDNQVAMHIASNPVFHERRKHIEVDATMSVLR